MKRMCFAIVTLFVGCGSAGEILSTSPTDSTPPQSSATIAVPAALIPTTTTASAPTSTLVISTAPFISSSPGAESRLRIAIGQDGCGYQLLHLEVVASFATPYATLFPNEVMIALDEKLAGANNIEVLPDGAGTGRCETGDTVFTMARYGFPLADPATGAITLGASDFRSRKILGTWECTKFFPAPTTTP